MSTTTIEISKLLFYSLLAFVVISAFLIVYFGITMRGMDQRIEEFREWLAEKNDVIHGMTERIDYLEELVEKQEEMIPKPTGKLTVREEIKIVADFVGIGSEVHELQRTTKKKLSSMSTDEVRAIYQDPNASEFEHEAAWMELTSRRGQLSDRGVASYSSGRPGMVPI